MMTSKKLVNNKSGISNLSHGLLHVEVTWPTVFSAESLPCETSLTDLDVWKSPVWLDFSAPLRKSLRLWQRASLWLGHRSVQTGSQDRCGKDGCPRQWCHEHDPGETGPRDSCFISLESLSLLILLLVFVFIPSSGPLRLLLSSIDRWTNTWARQPLDWHVHLDGEDGTRHGQQKVLHGKRNVRHVRPPLLTVWDSVFFSHSH